MAKKEPDLITQLSRVDSELEVLHRSENVESGTHSVLYCSLMSRRWGLQVLISSREGDIVEARQCSFQSREWEKAKATALEKQVADKMERILKRLDAEDQMAAEMEEIDD